MRRKGCLSLRKFLQEESDDNNHPEISLYRLKMNLDI